MAPEFSSKNYSFMTCIVKVHGVSSWQNTVRKVLRKCHGVYNFRMDDAGLVEISGAVDPELLLKMLGKAGHKAELRWFQFGECSSNLFMPFNHSNMFMPFNNNSYPRDGRFLHVESLPRPTPPSYRHIMSSSSLARNAHMHQKNSYYGQSYEDGYRYNNYRGQMHYRPDCEDICCCRVM